MIIDTKGFEIGDEVWWWEIDYDVSMDNKPIKILKHNKIDCFHYYKCGLVLDINDFYNTTIHINQCFRTEQDAINFTDEIKLENN